MNAIKVENVSKQYRLGTVSSQTLFHDYKRWIARLRGKEDPYQKITGSNDRTGKDESGYVWALKGIQFDVQQGEMLGVIGKNGAGKSTLLKILSRITTPTTGEIRIHGRMASLLEVGTGFHPELTGRENIFLNGAIMGMTKKEIKSRFDAIVDFAGVERYIDTPVKRYSSGMHVRLGFAVAAHLEPEILIVDEVLAVGDVEFQKKCVGKMKTVSGEGRTVLFVSHNMGTIRSLCKRGILLEKGELVYDGDINGAIEKYLQGGAVVSGDGSVPQNASKQNTSEGRIARLLLKNRMGEMSNEFLYGSPLKLEIQYESKIKIENCLIGIQINNNLNESVLDFVNVYDKNQLQVNEGLNLFQVELSNELHPGRYYLNVTVARSNGVTLDSLESILEFTVSNLGETADSGYDYGWKNGYLKGKASWTKV